VFFATGHTKMYAKAGSLNLLLGILVAFVLLAPKSGSLIFPGLQLGSFGLAIKITLIQFISTNILMILSSKICAVKYSEWVKFQIITIGLPLVFAGIAKFIVPPFVNFLLLVADASLSPSGESYLRILIGGVFYCSFLIGLIILKPGIIHLTRKQIWGYLQIK
jgi:hypothetical protein